MIEMGSGFSCAGKDSLHWPVDGPSTVTAYCLSLARAWREPCVHPAMHYLMSDGIPDARQPIMSCPAPRGPGCACPTTCSPRQSCVYQRPTPERHMPGVWCSLSSLLARSCLKRARLLCNHAHLMSAVPCMLFATDVFCTG